MEEALEPSEKAAASDASAPEPTATKTKVDPIEPFFGAACEAWLVGASGRELDDLARDQVRDVAARLTFARRDGGGVLTLPKRSRGGGAVALVASRPEARETTAAGDAAGAAAGARCASSLRVARRGDDGGEVELFAVDATAVGAPPTWTKLQVRTSCDGDALIALRLDVFPLVDEAADVLDLLLALPWLPPTALFPHIRNRLMEDLLVDLCELEGSDSDVEGTADEGPREPAPLCRKRAKAAE